MVVHAIDEGQSKVSTQAPEESVCETRSPYNAAVEGVGRAGKCTREERFTESSCWNGETGQGGARVQGKQTPAPSRCLNKMHTSAGRREREIYMLTYLMPVTT